MTTDPSLQTRGRMVSKTKLIIHLRQLTDLGQLLLLLLCTIGFSSAQSATSNQPPCFKPAYSWLEANLRQYKANSVDWYQMDTIAGLFIQQNHGMTKVDNRYLETHSNFTLDLTKVCSVYPQVNKQDTAKWNIVINTTEIAKGNNYRMSINLKKSMPDKLKMEMMDQLKLLCKLSGARFKLNKTDLEKMKLIGDVKSVTESVSTMEKRPPHINLFCTYHTTKYLFDMAGFMAEELEYDSLDNCLGKSTYVHDTQGNVTEQKTYYADGKLASKLTYAFNKNGDLVEQNEFTKDENPNETRDRKITYTYIKKGKNSEVRQFDAFGSLLSKSISTYHPFLETTEYTYNTDDSLFVKNSFSYDLYGKLLVSISYDATGKWMWKDTCMYNDEGYLVDKFRDIADDPEYYFSTRYEYKYNKDGVLVEEFDNTSYHRDSLSYKYDSYGNWTEKYIYRNEHYYATIIRKIEYH